MVGKLAGMVSQGVLIGEEGKRHERAYANWASALEQ